MKIIFCFIYAIAYKISQFSRKGQGRVVQLTRLTLILDYLDTKNYMLPWKLNPVSVKQAFEQPCPGVYL